MNKGRAGSPLPADLPQIVARQGLRALPKKRIRCSEGVWIGVNQGRDLTAKVPRTQRERGIQNAKFIAQRSTFNIERGWG
jgi:hypothetical protein